MQYIECKNCGGLYILDNIDTDFCEWCRSEFNTDEVIHVYKREKLNTENSKCQEE